MCSCATCHVYIDPAWAAEFLAPMSDDRELIESLALNKERPRHSFQIYITDVLAGLPLPLSPHTDRADGVVWDVFCFGG